MENMENGKDGLKDILDAINEKGIPSEKEMKMDLEETENSKFREGVENKLDEYKTLFKKFMDGSATEAELSRMADISAELEKLTKHIVRGESLE